VPAGYQPYGSAPLGRITPSAGLRKATIVLYWVTTAATLLLAAALFSRKGKWTQFIDGNASLQELDDADSFVGGSLLLVWGALLTSAILTCLWAARIANNSKARGATDVSSGLAAGGWFIPIGWMWVGFGQLSKAVKGVRASAPNLVRWQVFFILAIIGSGVIYSIRIDFTDINSVDDVTSTLNTQGVVGLGSAVLFVIASFFATRATKEIDTAVSTVA
jgi:hypothetical protein